MVDMRAYDGSRRKYFKIKAHCWDAFIAGMMVMYAYLVTALPDDQVMCVLYSGVVVTRDGTETGEQVMALPQADMDWLGRSQTRRTTRPAPRASARKRDPPASAGGDSAAGGIPQPARTNTAGKRRRRNSETRTTATEPHVSGTRSTSTWSPTTWETSTTRKLLHRRAARTKVGRTRAERTWAGLTQSGMSGAGRIWARRGRAGRRRERRPATATTRVTLPV